MKSVAGAGLRERGQPCSVTSTAPGRVARLLGHGTLLVRMTPRSGAEAVEVGRSVSYTGSFRGELPARDVCRVDMPKVNGELEPSNDATVRACEQRPPASDHPRAIRPEALSVSSVLRAPGRG